MHFLKHYHLMCLRIWYLWPALTVTSIWTGKHYGWCFRELEIHNSDLVSEPLPSSDRISQQQDSKRAEPPQHGAGCGDFSIPKYLPLSMYSGNQPALLCIIPKECFLIIIIMANSLLWYHLNQYKVSLDYYALSLSLFISEMRIKPPQFTVILGSIVII